MTANNLSTAIKVHDLSKIYKIYEKPSDRLRESLNPFGRKYHKPFYALNEVSFEILKGETIGIVGENGSGKSTLLKIITGVLTPSGGDLEINGKISALLELGAGFNPELTGMENIYLNGTIMGYKKTEMDKKIEPILEFADIGDFIYQPVKMYSSGMFARLAFAVAINVDPDILIVDEALSVGDAFFQNKCFHKLNEFQEMGKTILFVSHDIISVKQLCSKVMWLDKGRLLIFGEKDDVCAKYMNRQISNLNKITSATVKNEINKDIENTGSKLQKCSQQKYLIPKINSESTSGGTGKAEIVSFFIKNMDDKIVTTLSPGEDYTFHIMAKFMSNFKDVIFGFYLENNKGVQILGINSFMYGKKLSFAKKGNFYEAVFKVTMPRILKGEYLISPAIASGTQKDHGILNWYHNLYKVTIDNPGFNLSLLEIDSDVNIKEHDVNSISFFESN